MFEEYDDTAILEERLDFLDEMQCHAAAQGAPEDLIDGHEWEALHLALDKRWKVEKEKAGERLRDELEKAKRVAERRSRLSTERWLPIGASLETIETCLDDMIAIYFDCRVWDKWHNWIDHKHVMEVFEMWMERSRDPAGSLESQMEIAKGLLRSKLEKLRADAAGSSKPEDWLLLLNDNADAVKGYLKDIKDLYFNSATMGTSHYITEECITRLYGESVMKRMNQDLPQQVNVGELSELMITGLEKAQRLRMLRARLRFTVGLEIIALRKAQDDAIRRSEISANPRFPIIYGSTEIQDIYINDLKAIYFDSIIRGEPHLLISEERILDIYRHLSRHRRKLELQWNRDVGKAGEPFRKELEKAGEEARKPWWKREPCPGELKLRKENRFDIDIFSGKPDIESIEIFLEAMKSDYLICVIEGKLHDWVTEEEILKEAAERLQSKIKNFKQVIGSLKIPKNA